VVEALDVTQLTALPNRPDFIAGVVLHGNAALPVLDLRALRHGGTPHSSSAEGIPLTMVLCKGATGRAAFGLRVDELGPVMAVDEAAVRPMHGSLSVHDRHALGVVSFGAGAGGSPSAGPMLVVLDALGLGDRALGRSG